MSTNFHPSLVTSLSRVYGDARPVFFRTQNLSLTHRTCPIRQP